MTDAFCDKPEYNFYPMRKFKTLNGIVLAAGMVFAAMNVFADEPTLPPEATATPAPAPAPAATPPASPDQPSTDGKEKGKNCIWTCLQWGKECNVDTRGVYKCNRVCQQFGEQCDQL
jgi:hypothetical protein